MLLQNTQQNSVSASDSESDTSNLIESIVFMGGAETEDFESECLGLSSSLSYCVYNCHCHVDSHGHRDAVTVRPGCHV